MLFQVSKIPARTMENSHINILLRKIKKKKVEGREKSDSSSEVKPHISFWGIARYPNLIN